MSAGYYRNIKFSSLTKEEYDTLKDTGMLWEFYPQATGNYFPDMLDADKEDVQEDLSQYKLVHHPVEMPNHYQLITEKMMLDYDSIEANDIIEVVLGNAEDWLSLNEGRHYGNVMKYILRAPKKNKLEDLKKARKYLNWMIESLEGE